MADEEYQELTSEEDEEIPEDLTEAQLESLEGSYPSSKADVTLFTLFKDVLKLEDSTKVANTNKIEVGDLGISVRDAQKIGMLGHVFHHQKFGDFFFDIAEITNSTSMGRNGWFAELFVSSKKFTQRSKKSSAPLQEGKQPWKIFRKKQPTPGP